MQGGEKENNNYKKKRNKEEKKKELDKVVEIRNRQMTIQPWHLLTTVVP